MNKKHRNSNPRALNEAKLFVETIDNLVQINRLSQVVELDLLRHEDNQLAGKVAVAMWQRQPKPEIPENVRQEWEYAVVSFAEDDFWLADIFAAEPELGKRWLVCKLDDERFKTYLFERSIPSVVSSFDFADRKAFLRQVPENYIWADMISLIVGDSLELFESLLESPRDAYDKLCPLSRPSIDATWIEFAKLAYEHGHLVLEIVSHAFERFVSWSGKFSNVLKNLCEQFDAYRNDSDETVRRIAETGYQYYLDQYNQEKKREDDEDVYGRD